MLSLSFFSLDATLFLIYLLINLSVGIWYGKKSKTIQTYSLGNRNFSTLALTSTIVSTIGAGSVFLIVITCTYKLGLSFIIPGLSICIALLLIGRVFAPRMKEFLGQVSIGEAMDRLYGKHVRQITALCGIIRCMGTIAMQFLVSSQVLKAIFGLEGNLATVSAAFIVIIYASLGGIQAVTFTDVVQLFMFSVIIPLLGLIIWDTLPTPHHIVNVLTNTPQFNFSQLINNPKELLISTAYFVYFTIPHFYPTTFQRISMAKNIHQVKKSYTYAALGYIVLRLILTWIAIMLLADNAHLDMNNNNLIPHLMNRYTVIGFKGLLAIGIMAMVMSTADSNINAASVLLTNDIVQPWGLKLKNPLRLTRIFALIIGSLGLGVTFYMKDLLQIVMLVASFYIPIVTPPILLAILGFRSSTRPVLIGIAAGLATVILFLIFYGAKAYGEIRVLSGLLVNFIVYMSSHYLLRSSGGWVGSKDKILHIAEKKIKKNKQLIRNQKIKNFRIYAYLQGLLPKQPIYYLLLGMYILGVTYFSLHNLPEFFKIQHPNFYKFIRYGVVLMASSFITYPIWHPRLNTKSYITLAWPIVQFFLCIISGILAGINGFDPVHMLLLLFNLVVITLLMHWYIGIGMTALSIPISLFLLQHYFPNVYVYSNVMPLDRQLFFYIILLSIMLMLYCKQTYQK